MKGELLGCRDGRLIISGDDGERYEAAENELAAHERIVGTMVDFEAEGKIAQSLFVLKQSPKQKKMWLAAVLAILLGWLGIDRFYVGRPIEGALIAVAYIGGTLLLTMVLSNNPSSIDLMNVRGLIGPAFLLFGVIRGVVYLIGGQSAFSKAHGSTNASEPTNA